MPIKLFFALDVEDWIDPAADDAVLRLCRILDPDRAQWSHFTVGAKARVLRDRGRRDVVEAMARHEVCYHGNTHGIFPEPIAVYSNRLGWDEAFARCCAVESAGVADVAEVFGRLPVSWCQGEANWSPQAVAALRALGLASWSGATVGADNENPAWYCGQLVLRRAPHIVSVQPEPGCPDLFQSFQREFLGRMERKRGQGWMIVFGHPTRWVFPTWHLLPDLGLVRGRLVERPSQVSFTAIEPYSPAEVEHHFEQTRLCLDWVLGLEGVEPYTYAQLARDCSEPQPQWLALAELLTACRAWPKGEFDWATCGGTTLSAAGVFAAVVWALERHRVDGTLPETVPVRRILGPTYEYPVAAPEKPFTLAWADLAAMVRAAEADVSELRRVPHALRYGSLAVAPGPFLLAAMRALRGLARRKKPESVSVAPGPLLPACSRMDCFEGVSARFGSHSFPDGFRPDRVGFLALQQSWSFRPAGTAQRQ